MSAKLSCALFRSRTKVRTEADGTVVYQPSITVVAETSTTKRFAGATVCFKDTPVRTLVVLKATVSSIIGDVEYENIFKGLFSYSAITSTGNFSLSSVDDVELLEKLDIIFYDNTLSKTFTRAYKLNDKDCNGLTLKDFITAEYTFVDTDIQDYVVSKKVSRKYALPKVQRDYDVFWKSNELTENEKDYCRCKIDLDICMSNADKDMFKVLNRTLTAEYPERNWVLNILFGDPSSGKTTMIQNLCAMMNAPLVKLTGDPTISMTKLIMTVGPENISNTLTKQDYIDKLKSRGLSDSEIDLLDYDINKAVLNSKDVDVQLTEQESIILKCIKHHLPLVVLLDEVNMFTTLLMATLADVITSGYVNVGVHTYKDEGHNIMWFGAYNPNTYKCSPFEGKFRDRALFFCSEMPTEEQLIQHKQRKVVAKLFGNKAILSQLEEKAEALSAEHPEQAKEINDLMTSLSLICQSTTPSSEAVQWYFDYKSKELLEGKELSFNEKEFTDYYINDVTLADVDSIKEATARILVYANKVNELLSKLTKGIDTKNPDSNFSFYIPNRAMDYFTDLIFCFTSVKRATEFIIYNLLPNGNTLRYGNKENPAQDIADSITSSLSIEIQDLQAFLFSDLDTTAIVQALGDLNNVVYDSNLWLLPATGVADEPEDSSTTTIHYSTRDILDEAEEL